MPARSVCLVTLSLSEVGTGRFGGQASVTDIYHTMPCHTHAPKKLLFCPLPSPPPHTHISRVPYRLNFSPTPFLHVTVELVSFLPWD